MISSTSRDGYIRLRHPGSACEAAGAPAEPDAVCFIDLECDDNVVEQTVLRLRELPFRYLVNVTIIVVRSPRHSEGRETVVSLLHELAPRLTNHRVSWAVLEHPTGSAPRLEWIVGTPDPVTDDSVIDRCRAAELAHLLHRNGAIWQPKDYHFKLPSGHHTPAFVRVADAIATPRDADVISTWLLDQLAPRTGLIFDNRALVPVALSMRSVAERENLQLGPLTFLERYPNAQGDVEAAVREAASGGGGVIALLSVSSRGVTRTRLRAALAHAAQPHWTLNVLVDKARPESPLFSPDESPDQRTWLSIGDGTEDQFQGDSCPTCMQGNRRLVGIDPRFYNGMATPDPKLIVPSPTVAGAAQAFWTACDQVGAVGINHVASTESAPRRSEFGQKNAQMSVFVSADRLIAEIPWDVENPIRTAVRHAITEVPSGASATPGPLSLETVDLVVVPEVDMARQGYDAFLAAAVEDLCLPRDVDALPIDTALDPDLWPNEVAEAIENSKHVLVLSWSSVSGHTLQRLLVGCQEKLRKASASAELISGVVIHSRHSSGREWATLRNSYGGRLRAVFQTLLPTEGPFESELSLLDLMSADLDLIPEAWRQRVADFIANRQELASGNRTTQISATDESTYQPLLWGMPESEAPHTRIRQHSIFGDRLSVAPLLAAVGSVVHAKRDELHSMPGPTWHLFELPAIFRSYYDPLILAAILRWVDASEMWWGESEPDSVSVVRAGLERSTTGDLGVLVPELLLAAAMGKLPLSATEEVRAKALAMLGSSSEPLDNDIATAVAAGLLALATEQTRSSDDTTRIYVELPPP